QMATVQARRQRLQTTPRAPTHLASRFRSTATWMCQVPRNLYLPNPSRISEIMQTSLEVQSSSTKKHASKMHKNHRRRRRTKGQVQETRKVCAIPLVPPSLTTTRNSTIPSH